MLTLSAALGILVRMCIYGVKPMAGEVFVSEDRNVFIRLSDQTATRFGAFHLEAGENSASTISEKRKGAHFIEVDQSITAREVGSECSAN